MVLDVKQQKYFIKNPQENLMKLNGGLGMPRQPPKTYPVG